MVSPSIFSKAFDNILIEIVFAVMDEGLWKGLRGMCSGIQRRFKIDGYVGEASTDTNGILQGCPLSVMLLNVLVAALTAALKENVRNESYVDDLTGKKEQNSSKAAQALRTHTQTIFARYVTRNRDPRRPRKGHRTPETQKKNQERTWRQQCGPTENDRQPKFTKRTQTYGSKGTHQEQALGNPYMLPLRRRATITAGATLLPCIPHTEANLSCSLSCVRMQGPG